MNTYPVVVAPPVEVGEPVEVEAVVVVPPVEVVVVPLPLPTVNSPDSGREVPGVPLLRGSRMTLKLPLARLVGLTL